MKRIQMAVLIVAMATLGSCGSGGGAEETDPGLTLAPYVEPEADSKGGPPVKPPVEEQECCKVTGAAIYDEASKTPSCTMPAGKEDKGGGATGSWNTTIDCDKPITEDILDDICEAKSAGQSVPPGAHDPVCKAYCKNCASKGAVIDAFKAVSDWEGIFSSLMTALSISDTLLDSSKILEQIAVFHELAGNVDWIENLGKTWAGIQCLKGIYEVYQAAKTLIDGDNFNNSHIENVTKLYCALQSATFACQGAGFSFLPAMEAIIASHPHLAALIIGAGVGCAIGAPLADWIKCNSFEPACAAAICNAQPIPLDSCCICGWVPHGTEDGPHTVHPMESMYAANKGDCEGKDLCKKDSNGVYIYAWAGPYCDNGTHVECLWRDIDLDKSSGCTFCSVRYMSEYCTNDNRTICLTHIIYDDVVGPIEMPPNPCAANNLNCDEVMTPEEFEKLIGDRPVCPPEPPPAVKPDCTAETEGEKWCENDLILECRVKEDGSYDWWGVYYCSDLRQGASCVDGKCVGGTPPEPECTDPEGSENSLICAEDKTGILSCHKNGGVYSWEEIQNCSSLVLVCDDTGDSPKCVIAPTGDCDPPCGADETCVDGMCSPTSTDCDPPCNADETCMAGVCSPTSTEKCNPPCGDGESCVDGMCSPTSPSPTDCDPPCEDSEICVDGVCVDNSDPAPPPE